MGNLLHHDQTDVAPFDGITFSARECWDFMCHGCKLVKVSGKKENHVATYGERKYFILDEDLMGFRYSPTRKPKGYKISLESIIAVLHDTKIPANERLVHYHKDCHFIVQFEMDSEEHHVHVVAFSIEVAKKWIFGLEQLIKRRGLLLSKPDPLRNGWLKSAFDSHDKDNNGALSFSEVQKLLNSLNINLDHKQLKQLFDEANIEGIQGSKEGSLTREEFADFFKAISMREELVSIMKKHSETSTFMTAPEFQYFLKQQQGMDSVSIDDCTKFIQKYEIVTQLKDKDSIGIDGLTAFLKSPHGDIFNSDYDQVYQDMNHPLAHYFIASSHNTYLMMDQLTGPSSVEAYKNALKKGIRCVELDCWDGDDNEPVIYHGHTLTSKILFKDVIKTVKEYGFVASPYPVILSLENHCSVEQQKVMAKHMSEILGDQLHLDPVDLEWASLPSPEALKMKFIIKGKKLRPDQEELGDQGDVSEEDEAAELDQEGQRRKSNGSDSAVPVNGRANNSVDSVSVDVRTESISESMPATNEEHDGRVNGNSDGESAKDNKNENDREKTKTKRKEETKRPKSSMGKKLKLAKELSHLVNCMQAVKFRTFELYQNNKCYHMSSFGEAKFLSLGEANSEDFVRHNKRFLCRTYPAGKRVDSSNYNPQDAWNYGCQIVALNCQTDGTMMDFYLGKFRDNGRSGYILKPHPMRDESISFDPHHQGEYSNVKAKTVKVKVISGQQFPKPKNSKKKDVIDPYVCLEIQGVPQDRKEKPFITRTVSNNGFNPVWNDWFDFKLMMPELALLRFTVYDADQYGSDDFVGQFSLPFTAIRTGYRHVHLLSKDGEPVPNASIFVFIGIEDSA